MDDIEARVKCLELASVLCQRTLDHSVDRIVEFAMVFYSFLQTPLQDDIDVPVEQVDKPKRGRPKPKMADLLE